MQDNHLKKTIVTLKTSIKEFVEEKIAAEFIFMDIEPEKEMQYWSVGVSIWAFDDHLYDIPLGFFVSKTGFNNSSLDINTFFENNNKVFSLFNDVVDGGSIDNITSLLDEIVVVLNDKMMSVAIDVEAHIYSKDIWLRNVCQEFLFILHNNENNPDVMGISTMQNERYRIKISKENGDVFLDVPFDKVSHFSGHERVEGLRNQPYYEFEVALSFAGEDRDYVRSTALELRKKRVRIFYDEFEEVNLWGKDLYSHLDDIYRKKAKYCVIFLSEHYKNKAWTNHERESAQARAFEENEEYILPVMISKVEIPGVRSTVGYIDAEKYSSEQLAELIYKKIHGF